MNKLSLAAGPPTLGLPVRYANAGDHVALCLRGSGRATQRATGKEVGRPRRRVGRPRLDRSRRRTRGRQGGELEQASSSEEQPETQDGVVHNTVTHGSRPGLENDDRFASGAHAPRTTPASGHAFPLIPPGPNPRLDRVPYRVPNPNFSAELPALHRILPPPRSVSATPPARTSLDAPPAPPTWSNPIAPRTLLAYLNLSASSTHSARDSDFYDPPLSIPSPGLVSPTAPGAVEQQGAHVPVDHRFWNHHFPWNFLQFAELPVHDLMFWRELQPHAPTGVLPHWLAGIARGLTYGAEPPPGMGEVSAWAMRRWLQRSELSQPTMDQAHR